jgi:GTPase SAR1 family protein
MNESTTTMGTKVKVKIVLLGDSNVGKSSIIDKYINGRFDPNCSVQLW